MAETDDLTGLLNRRAFDAALRAAIDDVRAGGQVALALADLDGFKAINDAHGHAMGDRVLQAVSTILMEISRGGDITARWGGEEFIILLPETRGQQAAVLAERLRTRIEEMRLGTLRKPIQLSASFGIAERGAHESLDQLINDADEWLYRAKEAGRNRVSGFSVLPT